MWAVWLLMDVAQRGGCSDDGGGTLARPACHWQRLRGKWISGHGSGRAVAEGRPRAGNSERASEDPVSGLLRESPRGVPTVPAGPAEVTCPQCKQQALLNAFAGMSGQLRKEIAEGPPQDELPITDIFEPWDFPVLLIIE